MEFDGRSALEGSRILVTGGCGFIGSALVRHLIRECQSRVLNVDSLTYAGSLSSVASVAALPGYEFKRIDICDGPGISNLINSFQPDAIVHLAAESHVDRSIDEPSNFVRTNIIGTYTLLAATLAWFQNLPLHERARFRFLHVSTDEVFGSLEREAPAFVEDSQYRPNSPYSATKAASDHLVRAWGKTYGLPVIVSNCTNNYGPFQLPEKLIQTMNLSAINAKPLPVYGTGENIRDWLYVEDHVAGLVRLLGRGGAGETYLIGAGAEIRNIDLVRQLCDLLDELRPGHFGPYRRLIAFVPDRPGHDFRYAIDSKRIRTELGWSPAYDFTSGLRRTIEWYLANESWWQERLGGRDAGVRLGLGKYKNGDVARETSEVIRL